MLQKLRDQSGSWFVKVLLGAVALSMGAFGIVDVIRSIGRNKPAVTVGDDPIAFEALSVEMKKFAASLQKELKKPVGMKELQEFEAQKQVLEALIEKSVMAQEIKRLGLVASDTAVRDFVRHFPLFKDESGRFSLERFHTILRHSDMNMDEKGFLDQVRTTLQEQQLMLPLTYGTKLPNAYVDVLYQALQTIRHFAYVTIPYSRTKVTESPQESDLQSIYKQNQDQFTRPETRDVDVLYVSPDRVYRDIKIPEDLVREQYDQRKATDFTIPEKRDIKRLTFPTKEKALVAMKAVKKVTNDKELKDFTAKNKVKVSNFGKVTLKDATDSGAELAFKLPKNGATELVITNDRYDVYVVTDIVPAKQETYEAAKVRIEQELKDKEAAGIIQEIRKKVEDAVSGGSKFEEVAKELKVDLIKANGINAQGIDLYGKSPLPKNVAQKVAEEAFKLSAEDVGEFVETADNNAGFVVHLNKVTPSFVIDFASVKDDVKRLWAQEKMIDQTFVLAEKTSEGIKTLESLEALALKEKLSVTHLPNISRISATSDEKIKKLIPGSEIVKLFTFAKGSIAIPLKDGVGIFFLKDEKVPVEDKKSKGYTKFAENMLTGVHSDMSHMFAQHVRKSYVIKYNDDVLKRIDQAETQE